MKYSISSYRHTTNRLFLLDYDGTLAEFNANPGAAKPSARSLAILHALAHDPKNTVAIISGRDNITLEAWLGHLPIIMYAEHGILRRDKNKKWVNSMPQNTTWRVPALDLFNLTASNLPGSFVEEKTSGLAWHYRNVKNTADAEQARQSLLLKLATLPARKTFTVLDGNKVIEVKPAGTDKGSATREILSTQTGTDFILSAGDDVTDETMFAALPKVNFAVAVKVGDSPSVATQRVAGVAEFLDLLETLYAA